MLNRIIDYLQAKFPPNRIVVLLGGVLTAVSGTVAAWLAVHFPGLSFGAAEVAGIMAGAVLISIRLLDRWIDQWQKGEKVDYPADIEAALEELGEDPALDHALAAFGTLEGVAQSVGELRTRVEGGNGPNQEQLSASLGSIGDAIAGFLHQYQVEPEPAPAEALNAEVPPVE